MPCLSFNCIALHCFVLALLHTALLIVVRLGQGRYHDHMQPEKACLVIEAVQTAGRILISESNPDME